MFGNSGTIEDASERLNGMFLETRHATRPDKFNVFVLAAKLDMGKRNMKNSIKKRLDNYSVVEHFLIVIQVK